MSWLPHGASGASGIQLPLAGRGAPAEPPSRALGSQESLGLSLSAPLGSASTACRQRNHRCPKVAAGRQEQEPRLWALQVGSPSMFSPGFVQRRAPGSLNTSSNGSRPRPGAWGQPAGMRRVVPGCSSPSLLHSSFMTRKLSLVPSLLQVPATPAVEVGSRERVPAPCNKGNKERRPPPAIIHFPFPLPFSPSARKAAEVEALLFSW